MSVKVCCPPPLTNLPTTPIRKNNKKRPILLISSATDTCIDTEMIGQRQQQQTDNSNNQLTAQQRREALKLSFQRSFSEPLGGVAGRVLGVPCTPTVESPPSVSPSLHPSKRCRMMQQPQKLLAPPQSIEAGSVSLPTSPCSESSTLQRTLLLKNARTVDPNSLAVRIETDYDRSSLSMSKKNCTLIIDCRPFIGYNVNHIRGAINVNCCDRFNRKRLQQGKATLADLATTKEGKELLKKRTWKEVFVYDECSESLETLPSSHTLFLVLNALVEDHREPVMLLGGLRDFQVTHRGLCEDHLMQNAASMSPSSKYLPDLPSPSELCDTKDIENHPTTKVLPHLFLGNMRDASDMSALDRLNIRYILNVTAKPPTYSIPQGFQYKHLEAADNGIQNLRQFFEEAFDFIDEAKKAGTGVLVHCQAGISRSPTIAVAYLMKHYPMAMADAYKFVKTKRSIISPNLNFMGQLWEFEQVLKNNEITKDSIDNQKSLGATLKSLGELKTPSTASTSSSAGTTPFMWSQASDVVSKNEGIYSAPAISSGCSV